MRHVLCVCIMGGGGSVDVEDLLLLSLVTCSACASVPCHMCFCMSPTVKKHPSAIVQLMCYRIEDQSREKSKEKKVREEEFREKSKEKKVREAGFKEKSLYQYIKTVVMTKLVKPS